jgi:hypothetical protein
MSFNSLILGNKYSKKDLSEIFDNPNILIVREGIYNVSNSESFFFVDLEKKGKEDRFHFDDYFEGDFFHWDSQTTQHIETPKIQEIVKGLRTPHLFIRVTPKVKNTTQPFVYCGRLKYVEYIEGTSKPVHLIFQNIDYQDDTENKDLLDVYFWKPDKIGGSSQFKITDRETVSEDRKRKLKEPNITERSGLVTSRVGQGYYRQQIIEKWEGKCPVTQSELLKILISSHIVPWSECNDKERLDVENGILLSPNVDSLFDKHLISFSDNGQMIISERLSGEGLKKLGIPEGVTIKVTEGMKKYLQRHRERLLQND